MKTQEQLYDQSRRQAEREGAVYRHAPRQPANGRRNKPRLTIDQLARINRCKQNRAQGRPCNEVIPEQVRSAVDVTKKVPAVKWSYGVMTVPARMDTLLPRTLASLAAAGFDRPRLFVDGVTTYDINEYLRRFNLPVTPRLDLMRVAINWHTAFLELYLRGVREGATRFALFQDDIICVKNMREYVEAWYPDSGYMNLYTCDSNTKHVRASCKGEPAVGWRPSNQFGRGALALVFDVSAAQALLTCQHMVKKVFSPHRGWRCVDGGIVEGLKEKGVREFIHYPSLTRHTGHQSVMDKRKPQVEHDPHHPVYTWPSDEWQTFPGEDFSALDWFE